MQIDGFEVGDELGRGGFGVVYRARQLAFNRLVAVKILHGGQSEDLQKQFARECRAVGALRNHRNILRVYSTGVTSDGAPYLAMELLTGGSLADRLPLGVDAVRTLGTELASALQVAHEGGVIHRDVKPGNVLYNDDDEPVLVDFGISSLVGDPSTTSTEIALSLGYAPPEVLGNARPAVAADVYALGATLFAALSGRTPFVGQGGYTSIAVLAARILNEPVDDLRPLGIPDDMCAVIERAMAKQPAERFASMDDMRIALGRVRGDETVRLSDIARRPTRPMPPEAPTPPARRQVGRAVIASVAAIVLALAGIGVAIGLHRSSTSGHPAAGGSHTSLPTTTIAGAVKHDATDLNCNGYDDLLGVGSYQNTDKKLLFYTRGRGPDAVDHALPTTWIAANQAFDITNPYFGDDFTTLILPGDVNGDGKPDLLGEDSGDTLRLMRGKCTGAFDPTTSTVALEAMARIQFTADGDFDGDHHPDLLGVDPYHQLNLYHGLADGEFGSGVRVYSGGTRWTSAIGVGDVNGDGHPDVLDRRADGSLWLFESNGLGGWLSASHAAQGGLRLDLTLPPKQFPYVIGRVRFFGGTIADLAAIDVYGRLLVYRATGSPAPSTYSLTCYRAGQGWLHRHSVRYVADAVSVPSVPVPVGSNPKVDPIQAACQGAGR